MSFSSIQREAQNRGDSNPLFTGALGIYNGVVIHAHEGVNFDNGGSGSGCRKVLETFSWAHKQLVLQNHLI
jgi:hypothetical protein